MNKIEIECLYAGGSPCGVFCKGNVSDDEFMAAVREYDDRMHEDNAECIQSGTIEHVKVRCVPYRGANVDSDEEAYYFRRAESGHGAFDITYADFEGAIEF